METLLASIVCLVIGGICAIHGYIGIAWKWLPLKHGRTLTGWAAVVRGWVHLVVGIVLLLSGIGMCIYWLVTEAV